MGRIRVSAADAAQCSANDGTEAVIADVSLIGRRSPLIASAAGRGAALLGEWRVFLISIFGECGEYGEYLKLCLGGVFCTGIDVSHLAIVSGVDLSGSLEITVAATVPAATAAPHYVANII